MWVLQISHCYYPPFLDCARQYAVLFKNSNYKILTVFLTGKADPDVAKEVGHGEVIFLEYESKDVSGLKLGAIKKIRALHQKYQFEFCIAHRAKPTYVALLATSVPVISIRHNYGDFKRFSRRLMVNLFQKRIHILAVSDSVRDEIRLYLSGWPAERIQTFYNHIDVQALQSIQISRQEARHALGLPQDAWVVGNVGRLHRDKDQATLLRGFRLALSKLPANTKLVIIGKGPLEADLKRLAVELGVNESVVFTGNVPNAKRYFKAFDVFVLTSDHEPFGMVLLEAMAAEVPLICSDCGGGAEIAGNAGLLFKLGDSIALADALGKSVGIKKNDTQPVQQVILSSVFSDEAARVNFWQMPFVKKLVAQ